MRTELGEIIGQRKRFYGAFDRVGQKRPHRFGWDTLRTVLMRDIRDESGRIVADHLWFNMTVQFEDATLFALEGEIIGFDARIDGYRKGYPKDGYDYKLSRPTKVVEFGFPEWTDWEGPSFYMKENAPAPTSASIA